MHITVGIAVIDTPSTLDLIDRVLTVCYDNSILVDLNIVSTTPISARIKERCRTIADPTTLKEVGHLAQIDMWLAAHIKPESDYYLRLYSLPSKDSLVTTLKAMENNTMDTMQFRGGILHRRRHDDDINRHVVQTAPVHAAAV